MEELYNEGILKAIGVSNFYPDRLVDIASFDDIVPMVNQVETHVLNQQTNKTLIAYLSYPLSDGTDANGSASRVIVDDKLYGSVEYMAKIIEKNTDANVRTDGLSISRTVMATSEENIVNWLEKIGMKKVS